ncbi:MAG: site-specific DNA-methyltransferase [Methanoregula sp.]|jgi:site-specific DNA-methyltransferase (adenine-specific)
MILQGDCLDILPTLPGKSVDMILCDLPYGTTACKWDTIIPFEPLWKQYERLIKDNGAIVLTASQPFTSALVMSNPKWFKWEDVWFKSRSTGHLNCNVMPLRQHENILVFGNGKVNFHPQIYNKSKNDIRPFAKRTQTDCYGTYAADTERTIDLSKSYPRSVIQIHNTNHGEWGLHPTQKPIALFQYLILTYTNEGDTVLDNCAGSGTTGVACLNTNRKHILIEKDAGYCEIIRKRIYNHEPLFAANS